MRTDPRLRRLRAKLEKGADPEHAAFHRDYHKSALGFFGLRTPALRTLLREVFPGRKPGNRETDLPACHALWASPWFEERALALLLLERLGPSLGPEDLPWLHRMTRDCDGWALLDQLVTRVVGELALCHGEPAYGAIRRWSDDEWLWTRRAAILVHVVPARRGELAHAFAWPTFEERLPEREFFIRKAVGWALRECTKHYPREVHAFLLRVGNRASGLTRREGARRLPPKLRKEILGK